ncbi:MAG: YfbM family protein [Pirellulaceae bacterium]
MIGNFLQVTPQQLNELIAAPESIEDLLYRDGDDDSGIDIDKAWHGIHFMLTGQQYEGTPPFSDVIFATKTVGDDVGYGPARYLTAAEVAAVADALSSLPSDEFGKRYDAAALTANDIYPQIWSGDEDLDYLLSWYDTLRDYYLDAAAKGNAMLQYLN